MSQEQWTAVDEYINGKIVTSDEALSSALSATQKAGLPEINVAPNQGKLLYLLAKISGAQKILEIGTLAGYSTIWLARALGDGGHVTTLEFDPKHATVAEENIKNAGLSNTVSIRVGAALDTLPLIEAENIGPFDFIFIDADKVNNPNYLNWAIKLSRPGTVIICDNVIREGAVVDEADTDPAILGTRKFFDLVAADNRLSATAIQTVGSKGYDGFAIAVVL